MCLSNGSILRSALLLDWRRPASGEPDDGTDIGALAAGYVSVTPLNLDMTDTRSCPVSDWCHDL